MNRYKVTYCTSSFVFFSTEKNKYFKKKSEAIRFFENKKRKRNDFKCCYLYVKKGDFLSSKWKTLRYFK